MRAALVVILIVAVGTVANGDPKSGGYWCWLHQDGATAACAPREDECKASLAGFNEIATAVHDSPVKGTCSWQKSAWQLILKEPLPTPRYFPTKKLCTTGLSKGENCKEVR